MRNEKKTRAEKAETRAGQNRRYSERKAARGLVRISVWVSREGNEEAEKLGLRRVGVVYAADDGKDGTVWLRRYDCVEPLSYAPSLLEF